MSYLPEFKGPIEGYVANYLAKNLWRISATHDRDDAMQEAYIVFLRCAAKYPLLDEAKHFMALFKTAWSNEVADLSTKATRARKSVSLTDLARVDDNGDEVPTSHEAVGSTDNEGILGMLVKEAPSDVMLVINLFLNAPAELMELALETWKQGGKHNAGGERHVEKMLGLPMGTNPIARAEKYFCHK